MPGPEPTKLDVEIPGDGHQTVAAYHFTPSGTDLGVLQVLVHGGTYDHRYWDAPEINGRSYSYARWMAARGYSVLAVDQLGTGASTRPPADTVNLPVVAAALDGLVGQARHPGGLLGRGFERVALVGHSIGTIVSVYTQAVHHPADVLVTTGLGHVPFEAPSPFGEGALEAALTEEYGTLPPEARRRAFYFGGSADPDVVAFDNGVLRSVMARGLLVDALQASGDLAASRVADVTGPVYVQLGEHDLIGPAALSAEEAGAWRSAERVTVEVIGHIGHCFNLHTNNEESWSGIDGYLREWMGVER